MNFMSALFRFFLKKREWDRKYLVKRIKHMLDMVWHVSLMKSTYKSLMTLKIMNEAKLSQITQRMISGNYCGKNFSLTEKLNTVLHHYTTVDQRFVVSFLPTEDAQIIVWKNTPKLHGYEIRLAWSDHPTEGELSLLFCIDDVAIYTISFTFVNASLLGTKEKSGSDGILITRVQGLKDSKLLVNTSSKEHFQSYPTFLLYAALQGVAQAMDYKFIIGICADFSLNFKRDADKYYGAYNAFWEKLGGHRMSKSYFGLPVSILKQNLEEVSAHHRKRAFNRHQLKQGIIDEVSKMMSLQLVNPSVTG
jgi:uncharacterized protein VirK/YbjX